MRLLHLGDAGERRGAARDDAAPIGGRRVLRTGRKSLPLRLLPAHRSRGAARSRGRRGVNLAFRIAAGEVAAKPLPGSLRVNPRLSQWLRLRAAGFVEVSSGKVE